MYVGSYEFTGDPDTLIQAYGRLMAGFPPGASDLHMCVRGDAGISVLDACPSRAVFDEFSRSPEFTAAIAEAGLPVPEIRGWGEVHAAHLRADVAP
ncbi:MAG: hypothetical protein ACXVQU_07595 [Actinomycetota bacterium]